MHARTLHTLARLGFAALAVVAIAVQLLDLADRGVLDPVNFFSYFTIQSNLIAIAALLWAALGGGSVARDTFRGAATTYTTVTFIVFALLLADIDVDTAIVWVDRVLHRVIPVWMVADWLLEPPRAPIPFRRALWWVAYPAAWLVYTLLRGLATGWYPYPFLDPANGGYPLVALYSLAILLGMLAIIWVVARVGSGMGRRAVSS